MTVIRIQGKPRTGKTLLLCILGKESFDLHHEIFANFWLKFKYNHVDTYDILRIPFGDVDRHPKTLLIQEADKIFDSWSKNNENRLLSSLTGQSGKRNLNIFYDTQFPNRINKSLRDVTEYVITTHCYIDSVTKDTVAFKYTLTDIYEYERNPEYRSKSVIITVPDLLEYFEMYNTYQATKPMVKTKTNQELSDMYES